MSFTEQERYEQWRHAHGFDRYAGPKSQDRTTIPGVSEYLSKGYHCDPGESYGDCISNTEGFLGVLRNNPELNPEVHHFYHPSIAAFPTPARRDLKKSEDNPGYWETDDPIDEDTYAPAEHYAPVVTHGGRQHVVDWAMRQFDPKAGVPHIEPLEDYKKRFSFSEPDDIGIFGSSNHHTALLTPKGVHKASRWYTAGWDDYDDDQRQSEEDAAWADYDDEPYHPTDEELRWLKDDSSEIPEDPDVEAQARQDAVGSGFSTAEDAAHDELADERNKDWATYEDLIPPKDFGRNGPRPPMTMEPVGNLATDGIMARHAADGRPIGHLMWHPSGEIASVNTHPDFGGRGIANAMLHHARSNPEVYHDGEHPIHHSSMLSPHGEAWARSDPHHTMPRNFTSVDVTHGAGTKKPYSNYLGAGQEYIPANQRYTGQTEDFMAANRFTGKPIKSYTGVKPPPRQYVPPGQGHLGDHWGPKATTMNWGGSNG